MTSHSERLERFRAADLYVVITEAYCGGRGAIEVLDAVLDAGVLLVQLREKRFDDRTLFARARQFRERTAKAGALLIIDDRVDIALAAEADGVHLGQTDLPAAAARSIAPELLTGVSSHSAAEAVQAQADGASYVNIGPIFDTQTKSVPGGAIGPEAIVEISQHLKIPFSVMGGIKRHNVQETLDRGARIVAVVTAVTAAADVHAAASALRNSILPFRAAD